MSERPLLAITMGDAAGIGPEVIAKTLADPEVYRLCRPVVLGLPWALEDGARIAQKTLRIHLLRSVHEAAGLHGQVDLLEVGSLRREEAPLGKVSAACGRASLQIIERAAQLALAGEVAAVVTCPINKEALQAAGSHDIGHQEILARMAGATRMSTVLMTPGLRVVHLSTHKTLIQAAQFVTTPNVLAALELAHDYFERWGLERPRIGVAGLNPHGGEAGLLGREELDEIAPAVAAARVKGIDARGPYPADSIFYRAINGEFDAVLAMYHDQGHIAVKVHGFEQSVTANMGLPFVRTSVDHGTAFDIAGKGIASHVGLIEALKLAVTLTTRQLGAARSSPKGLSSLGAGGALSSWRRKAPQSAPTKDLGQGRGASKRR